MSEKSSAREVVTMYEGGGNNVIVWVWGKFKTKQIQGSQKLAKSLHLLYCSNFKKSVISTLRWRGLEYPSDM